MEWYLGTSQKVHYKMKLIKEVMQQLAFPEMTMFTPPTRKVPTKGAKERVRSTRKEALTSRISSSWERADSRFPDSQSSPTKSLFPKRKGARIGNPSCSPVSFSNRVLKLILVPTPIDHMRKFMKPFTEEKNWMLQTIRILDFRL